MTRGRKGHKIALVSGHASPLALVGTDGAGGQNVHVAELARALARLGSEVTVYTRRDDPRQPPRVGFAPGVTVEHVSAGPAAPVASDELYPLMAAFADELSARWSDQRPDVVLSQFWVSGAAALDPCRRLGIPLAHTFHSHASERRRHVDLSDSVPVERIRIEGALACQADLLIATRDEETSHLVTLGADTTSISVIPSGVDLKTFNPHVTPEPRPSHAHRVVVVSRLAEYKGIENVISAVSYLPAVELIIAGGPPATRLDDDPDAKRYRRLIDDLGMADRVELRGAAERGEVAALLRSADVVCCTPWYESIGLVAIEAMACGVPVVASAVGGLGELVIHGQTGLLVPPRNPERLGEAIQMILADADLRNHMVRTAVELTRRFGWQRIASETLRQLSQLVRADPSRTSSNDTKESDASGRYVWATSSS